MADLSRRTNASRVTLAALDSVRNPPETVIDRALKLALIFSPQIVLSDAVLLDTLGFREFLTRSADFQDFLATGSTAGALPIALAIPASCRSFQESLAALLGIDGTRDRPSTFSSLTYAGRTALQETIDELHAAGRLTVDRFADLGGIDRDYVGKLNTLFLRDAIPRVDLSARSRDFSLILSTLLEALLKEAPPTGGELLEGIKRLQEILVPNPKGIFRTDLLKTVKCLDVAARVKQELSELINHAWERAHAASVDSDLVINDRQPIAILELPLLANRLYAPSSIDYKWEVPRQVLEVPHLALDVITFSHISRLRSTSEFWTYLDLIHSSAGDVEAVRIGAAFVEFVCNHLSESIRSTYTAYPVTKTTVTVMTIAALANSALTGLVTPTLFPPWTIIYSASAGTLAFLSMIYPFDRARQNVRRDMVQLKLTLRNALSNTATRF